MKIPNKLSQFMYELDGCKQDYLKDYQDSYDFDSFSRFDYFNPLPILTISKSVSIYKIHIFKSGYNSYIVGRGCDIANGLCFGYRTDEDIAHRLLVSRRTADRILNDKNDAYQTKKIHIHHVLRLYNVQDDYLKHYHYDKKKRKWTLSKNHTFGMWKPKTVVDNLTFTNYEWLRNSPVYKDLRYKYKDTTRLEMLNKLFKTQQTLKKVKLKHWIFKKIVNKYATNSKTLSIMLFRANSYYADEINRIENMLRNQTSFPVLSEWSFKHTNHYFNYLIQKQYHNSWNKWQNDMKYNVTDALLYAVLYHQLADKYKDYKQTYHSDKCHLMTKSKWNILRFVQYDRFLN